MHREDSANQLLLAAAASVALLTAGGAQAATLPTDGASKRPTPAPATTPIRACPSANIAPIGATQGGWTFNGAAPGFTVSGGFVRPGSLGLWPGVSASTPGDLSNYETAA